MKNENKQDVLKISAKTQEEFNTLHTKIYHDINIEILKNYNICENEYDINKLIRNDVYFNKKIYIPSNMKVINIEVKNIKNDDEDRIYKSANILGKISNNTYELVFNAIYEENIEFEFRGVTGVINEEEAENV